MGDIHLVPRHAQADEDESAKVHDCFDGRVERVMASFDLGVVQSIPVQRASSNEAGQRLIGAETPARTDEEELKG